MTRRNIMSTQHVDSMAVGSVTRGQGRWPAHTGSWQPWPESEGKVWDEGTLSSTENPWRGCVQRGTLSGSSSQKAELAWQAWHSAGAITRLAVPRPPSVLAHSPNHLILSDCRGHGQRWKQKEDALIAWAGMWYEQAGLGVQTPAW